MDAKLIAAIGAAVLPLLGGTAYSAQGWLTEAKETAYAVARYRAAKELARACMGEDSFDAEWAEVLADIKEQQGRP
jgi:cytochrome c556